MDDDVLLRVEEAASLLRVSRSKVYELIAAHKLPAVRIGRSVRVHGGLLALQLARMATAEERVLQPDDGRGKFEPAEERSRSARAAEAMVKKFGSRSEVP